MVETGDCMTDCMSNGAADSQRQMMISYYYLRLNLVWDPIGRVSVKKKNSSSQNPNKIDFWTENIAGASQENSCWCDQFIQQVKMSIIAFLKANMIICE